MAARPLSAFSLMPFRATERAREGGGKAVRCLDALARTNLPPRPLSRARYWQTALPRHPPTLFRTCYAEYSARFFFRLPRPRRTKDPSRCSWNPISFLCNLRKVEAIPPFPEFWWHMEGLERSIDPRGGRGGGDWLHETRQDSPLLGCKPRENGRRLGLTSLFEFSFSFLTRNYFNSCRSYRFTPIVTYVNAYPLRVIRLFQSPMFTRSSSFRLLHAKVSYLLLKKNSPPRKKRWGLAFATVYSRGGIEIKFRPK